MGTLTEADSTASSVPAARDPATIEQDGGPASPENCCAHSHSEGAREMQCLLQNVVPSVRETFNDMASGNSGNQNYPSSAVLCLLS